MFLAFQILKQDILRKTIVVTFNNATKRYLILLKFFFFFFLSFIITKMGGIFGKRPCKLIEEIHL
jgi:hypothetical protein